MTREQQVREKIATRIGELKAQLDARRREDSGGLPQRDAIRRLEGNIGALEWAHREIIAIYSSGGAQ